MKKKATNPSDEFIDLLLYSIVQYLETFFQGGGSPWIYTQ